jgi:hypothetical protein
VGLTADAYSDFAADSDPARGIGVAIRAVAGPSSRLRTFAWLWLETECGRPAHRTARAVLSLFTRMHMESRDLMAPDTEPTDEELALVMREARDLAVQRRATADAWVAARLKEASIFGRANTQARRTDKSR